MLDFMVMQMWKANREKGYLSVEQHYPAFDQLGPGACRDMDETKHNWVGRGKIHKTTKVCGQTKTCSHAINYIKFFSIFVQILVTRIENFSKKQEVWDCLWAVSVSPLLNSYQSTNTRFFLASSEIKRRFTISAWVRIISPQTLFGYKCRIKSTVCCRRNPV